MEIDDDSGINEIYLSGADAKKSVSMSNDGAAFLDSLGADVVLHFDKENRLVSIELMGFNVSSAQAPNSSGKPPPKQ